ncbi:hypothetical protein [Euzebya tangerina]|uniref:hypothetical protein n=1 Tax=Euzebya tangerina TaxID=591198 RepID=UPI000E3137D3|nr:hypothetical protein [Euzebya tangerina]
MTALAEARTLRDDGAAAALYGTLAEWRLCAKEELQRLAESGDTFTSDDMVSSVGLPPAGSPNALGGLFAGASRQGLIEPVGYQQSQRKARHAGVVRTWRGRSE